MSLNEVKLIGNLGDAPDLRYMPSGDAACNFSVATSETWKDKQTGEKKEATEWHRCSAFDRGNYKMAQYIAEGCQKGTKIYISGSLHTRKYEKDGIERYATEIKVNDFEILANGVPRDGQPQGQPQQGGFQQQPQTPPAQPQSFGGNGQGGFGDPWAGLVPAGAPKEQGATLEQIKTHKDIGGDVSKAKQFGWVAESSEDLIPF